VDKRIKDRTRTRVVCIQAFSLNTLAGGKTGLKMRSCLVRISPFILKPAGEIYIGRYNAYGGGRRTVRKKKILKFIFIRLIILL